MLEKIARVYDPNLVMVQHRIKNDTLEFQGYFYAFAAKVEVRIFFPPSLINFIFHITILYISILFIHFLDITRHNCNCLRISVIRARQKV